MFELLHWFIISDTKLWICCSNLLSDASSLVLTCLSPVWKVVAFSHQLQIRDKHVIQLAMMCPNLKQIDASYCRLLTDASVMAVAEKLWALEVMGIQLSMAVLVMYWALAFETVLERIDFRTDEHLLLKMGRYLVGKVLN